MTGYPLPQLGEHCASEAPVMRFHNLLDQSQSKSAAFYGPREFVTAATETFKDFFAVRKFRDGVLI